MMNPKTHATFPLRAPHGCVWQAQVDLNQQNLIMPRDAVKMRHVYNVLQEWLDRVIYPQVVEQEEREAKKAELEAREEQEEAQEKLDEFMISIPESDPHKEAREARLKILAEIPAKNHSLTGYMPESRIEPLKEGNGTLRK